MTSRFQDKFDRADGAVGSNYTVACGGVTIFDEAILPVDMADVVSGLSPVLDQPGVTAQKTQCLYTAEAMDGPDQTIRAVWAHDPVSISGVNTDPSFTILARMSKDPLLYDLGTAEDPNCYDQGYGLRVTCPRSNAAPVLKFVKFMPVRRAIKQNRPSSLEPDGAVVLAQVTLQSGDLNIDPLWDETGNFPYRGFWQDMRLRIRRADNEVILEAYLNDRNLNTPILSHTDYQDPLWGAIGVPGVEFLSATLSSQPSGVSPFGLAGDSLMRCGLFSAETVKDFRRPVTAAPGNFYTYNNVVTRVITLVEKDGDARYNATNAGQTKIDTYLDFVLEAEAHIIRREGYYHWLYRESRIYLQDQTKQYEMPEDCGLIELVRPGNFSGTPLHQVDRWQFAQRVGNIEQTGGKPAIYRMVEESVNNRPTLELFPIPLISSIRPADPDDEPYLVCNYFARRLRPAEPDIQIPYVPQEHIDVLIYGAAAHAMMLDTDPQNAQAFAAVFESKLGDLRRENNRKVSGNQTVAVSAADAFPSTGTTRVPLLRSTQLENLLVF